MGLARDTVANAAMGKRGMQAKDAMGVVDLDPEFLGHKKIKNVRASINNLDDFDDVTQPNAQPPQQRTPAPMRTPVPKPPAKLSAPKEQLGTDVSKQGVSAVPTAEA